MVEVFAIRTDAPRFIGPPQGQWTYADWEKLPDDGNLYEIIEGVLYVTTTPSNFHFWITKQLYKLLGEPTEEQGIAEAVWAPVGVFMPGCDPVIPDFMLIRRANLGIMQNRHIYGVPDLIIEIISPGSRDYDEGVKLDAYAGAGVPEYGVIDPKERAIRVYRLEAEGKYGEARQYGAGEQVTFDIAPSIPVAVSALFEGAPDTTL